LPTSNVRFLLYCFLENASSVHVRLSLLVTRVKALKFEPSALVRRICTCTKTARKMPACSVDSYIQSRLWMTTATMLRSQCG